MTLVSCEAGLGVLPSSKKSVIKWDIFQENEHIYIPNTQQVRQLQNFNILRAFFRERANT
jgi:hypothetical protein